MICYDNSLMLLEQQRNVEEQDEDLPAEIVEHDGN